PGAGWIGLDPTSGLFAGEGHIPLAATPEPQSAAPVSGLASECEVDFFHEMSVTRIHEDPRVTKPYTDDQWRRLCGLAEQIDDELLVGDVRLTMGGEPTFVSIDDMDGDEWNTEALGSAKLRLAGDLIKRLRETFAPGSFLHFGQGKWYPGESLPRWALSCYWRGDGVAVWQNPELYADEARDYGHGPDDARRFARGLAQRLGVVLEHCIPGYEDAWYYMWRERQLPANVDPLRSRLADPEERKRLAKVFEQGLNRVVGYALPLRRDRREGQERWLSGPWFLRREHL